MKTKATESVNNILESTKTAFDTEGINWSKRKFSHPERTIRIATSFSGISAPDMALKRLGLKSEIVFASDIGERYLKYSFNQLRKFSFELNEDERFRFADALYKGNKAHVDSLNANYRKKGKEEIPFTFENVYDCLFNGSKVLKGVYELVKDCLDIIIDHKGLKDRREIENYVSGLYDEKGRNYVKDAFFANYEIKEEDWHTDIRFIDATPYRGEVDLYVGGSPCCSFSRSGKRLCMEDTRGELIYDYALRIKECQPKVFIFENVKDIMRANSKDEMSGLEVALTLFDELGYKLHWTVLDGADYGVPQHRERVWVVGFRKDIEVDFKFPNSIPLTMDIYNYLDDDILPKSGRVNKIHTRELTGTEYLRLSGFKDFNLPESISKLDKKKMNGKLRFMAGNSMVVECLMAIFLQMDITKYGVDREEWKLKPSLYDYSKTELDELISRAMQLKDRDNLDLSYLNCECLLTSEPKIIKIGATKPPKTEGKSDSQWNRIHSVRGICPTQTKVGKIYIIVSNEMRHQREDKPKYVEPKKRIPTPLW